MAFGQDYSPFHTQRKQLHQQFYLCIWLTNLYGIPNKNHSSGKVHIGKLCRFSVYKELISEDASYYGSHHQQEFLNQETLTVCQYISILKQLMLFNMLCNLFECVSSSTNAQNTYVTVSFLGMNCDIMYFTNKNIM